MKAVKQLQVVAIYHNRYDVIFTSKNDDEVKLFAKLNRTRIKNEGAIKVIVNIGTYYY